MELVKVLLRGKEGHLIKKDGRFFALATPVKIYAPELSTQSESTLNKENVLNESTDSTNISTSTPIRPHKKRQSVRKYQPNWLQTFSWIKYEEASDKVFC
ncbi:hypothetical protein Bhyg_07899, partial [Pseudolycoriella hygida]